MPTYIPVYQRRLDPVTGRPVIGPDRREVMDLIETIEIPDEPVYELTEEERLQMEENAQAEYKLLIESVEQFSKEIPQ
jgi:hypothetical protein